jgi:biopolymer transport protein ExbD
MGRFKVKKQDMFIDMTPMSDVMVLLLTFFMLTATFVKDEPVKVNTPGSVSEIKIPEQNLLTITINPEGKVFLGMDSPQNMEKLANKMIETGSLALSPAEMQLFKEVPMLGTSISQVNSWLKLENRNEFFNKSDKAGIPCDSVPENDELQVWVGNARAALGEGDKMRIAIKADKNTSYKVVKNVMNSLRRIDENRYNLITSLAGEDK